MTKTKTSPRTVDIANRHPRLKIDRKAITRAIRLLDAEFASTAKNKATALTAPPGELSLVFVTDEELAQLHGQFLDDPSITDVITFEGDAALETAGEICVSADAALRQTTSIPRRGAPKKLTGKIGEAFSTELCLYVVHGWLHLAGFDDLQPAKKRVMRRAEARAMTVLKANQCLPAFDLR
jgi:probable rRNA maturation factor